jgi:hypothetical protein
MLNEFPDGLEKLPTPPKTLRKPLHNVVSAQPAQTDSCCAYFRASMATQ